jgi:hypothetical protein
MQLIYKDLRKVHKIAMKSEKIGFKTKVDLLSELSKFIAQVSRRLVSRQSKLHSNGAGFGISDENKYLSY